MEWEIKEKTEKRKKLRHIREEGIEQRNLYFKVLRNFWKNITGDQLWE